MRAKVRNPKLFRNCFPNYDDERNKYGPFSPYSSHLLVKNIRSLIDYDWHKVHTKIDLIT